MKYPKLLLLSLVFSLSITGSVFADAVPEVKDNLTYGKKSPQVYLVQQELIKLGLLAGKATGVMYGNTMSAVRKFQEQAGINKTGVVGPETKASFNGIFSQKNDCLVVTVPQAGKVVSAPFVVSGFIKAGCAWMVSDGNAAGTVQLADKAGAPVGVPSYIRTHSITVPPRYPLFFTAQVNATVTPVSGAAMLLFSDNAPVPNTKLYQVTLR